MFEKILAYLLIFNELLKPFYLNYFSPEDYNWTNTIPLHACHFSSYATGFFLLTRNQKFFDFAYFWGLGGGTMALFTPDIEFTFPDLDFITLFSGHGLLFFALVYIVFVLKQNITFDSYKNALKFSLSSISKSCASFLGSSKKFSLVYAPPFALKFCNSPSTTASIIS